MISDIEKGILNQNHKFIAKAISLIENKVPESDVLLANLFPKINKAFRIGITGPPGCGKSTITNQLISKYKKGNISIGVLCIDPTSPFSGGAILGDRIRLTNHYSDSKVFIRSLASRDGSGGLSSSIEKVATLLDAAGFDIIIFETVGVGQIELDIVKTADSIVVVLNPESGDEVQMLKAGLMEIGDVFVINKSDRQGADKLFSSLRNYLTACNVSDDEWSPRVIQTVATKDKGISTLSKILDEHYQLIKNNGELLEKYNSRYIDSVRKHLNKFLNKRFWTANRKKIFKSQIDSSMDMKKSPQDLAKYLFLSDE